MIDNHDNCGLMRYYCYCSGPNLSNITSHPDVSGDIKADILRDIQ